MEKISIDTMGPFPVDKQGNIYLVVIVDCFSRYVELYPAADCTAEAAAAAIINHFKFAGVPKIILSDNGPQYANKIIDQLAQLTDIDLSKTMAYSHEENGLVERANKEVLRHLRSIMFEKTIKSDWSVCVHLVQRIMNATKHGSTGHAPAEIITPALNLNEGILFPRTDQPIEGQVYSEFVGKLYEKQALVVRLVQEHLADKIATTIRKRKQADDNAVSTNKRRKGKSKESSTNSITEYENGSYLLLAYPTGTRPPSKLHMPWMGPYQVVSHSGAEYLLRNLVTGKTLNPRHVSQLKRYLPGTISPLQVSAKRQMLTSSRRSSAIVVVRRSKRLHRESAVVPRNCKPIRCNFSFNGSVLVPKINLGNRFRL